MSKEEEGLSVGRTSEWKNSDKKNRDALGSFFQGLNEVSRNVNSLDRAIAGATRVQEIFNNLGGSGNSLLQQQIELGKKQLEMDKRMYLFMIKKDIHDAAKEAGVGGKEKSPLAKMLEQLAEPLKKVFKPLGKLLGNIGDKIAKSMKKSGMMPLL